MESCLLCGEPEHATDRCPYPPAEAAHRWTARLSADLGVPPAVSDMTPPLIHTTEQIAAMSTKELRPYVNEYQSKIRFAKIAREKGESQ